MKNSIMTEKLARRGLRVHQEYEVDVFHQITVGRVMDTQPAVVPTDVRIGDLAERIAQGEPALVRHQAILLANQKGELAGISTRGDLLRGLERDPSGNLSVLAAGTDQPRVAYADETLNDAFSRMLRQGRGRLPVVDRKNPGKIVGYLGRTAVLEARLRRLHEDHVREPGWLKTALRTSPN